MIRNLDSGKNIIRENPLTEDDISLEDEFAAYLKETKDENSSDDSFVISKNKIDEEGSFEDISESLLKNED